MPVAPGTRLGPYEVISLLGAGGMGEVYRACDPRLGREVAIKVLPPKLARDEKRRLRLLKEARAASALNHPNIVSVYELEAADGVDFIVMEQVAGRTLDAVIRAGLRLGDGLRIATRVADALVAAHAAGIVHRDLKPANVMVSADGAVKVLDFGLAKLVEPGEGGGEDETTLSDADRPDTLTRTGAIAGTPGYMSPEQATGGKVDARSDVFAFGSVLYEMVTGRRAFAGSTREETLRAVVGQPAKPPSEVVPGVPADLEKLILRCLRKEPERRFQHMSDVKVELQEVLEGHTSPVPVAQGRGHRRSWLAISLAGLALASLAAWGAWRARVPATPPRLVTLTAYEGAEGHPALSPDGEQVAFSWEGRDRADPRPRRHIWFKFVGGSELRQLTNADGNDAFPSWSPDGREIAFMRVTPPPTRPARVRIHIVSALGGPERTLGDFPSAFSQLAWASDGGAIVAARGGIGRDDDPASGAIHLLSTAGEPMRILTRPARGWSDSHPSVSPDGTRLAYASCDRSKPALQPCHIRETGLASLASAAPRTLTSRPMTVTGVTWAPDGQSIIYSVYGGPERSGLWRVSATGAGLPEKVELAGRQALQPFVSAPRNRLVFASQQASGAIWTVGEGGTTQPLMASLQEFAPSFSPDGRRIAFQSGRAGEKAEIWVAGADGAHPVRITQGPGWWQGSPRWSPDGRRIVFESHGEDGHADVWTIDVASRSLRRVTDGPLTEGQAGWSPDGRFIYYRADSPEGSAIWRVPDGGGPPERLTGNGAFNPFLLSDGRTLLFTRGRQASPLIARKLDDGSETELVDCVYGRSFDVGPGGLYFVGCPDGERGVMLHRLDRRTGRHELLARVEATADGIAVAPSGWPILYERVSPQTDLMLIENFR